MLYSSRGVDEVEEEAGLGPEQALQRLQAGVDHIVVGVMQEEKANFIQLQQVSRILWSLKEIWYCDRGWRRLRKTAGLFYV